MKNKINAPVLTEETILNYLNNTKDKKNFSYQELVSAFKVKGQNKSKLNRLLDKLISNGELYQETGNNTYTLFENSSLSKGQLVIDGKGNNYIETSKGKMKIPTELLNGASYDDVVIIDYDRHLHSYYVKKILKENKKDFVADIVLQNGKFYAVNDKMGMLEILNSTGLVDGHIALIEKEDNMAKVKKIICHKTDANADTLKIVYKHGFNPQYTNKMLQEVADTPDELTESMINEAIAKNVVDLRNYHFITIDCDDTKDIDDAANVTTLPDGRFKLITPVADVTRYVKDGTALSGRIKKEGTSIYPPGCVIPMLDRKLSNGICSLNPETDRFSLCFESILDINGNNTGEFNLYFAVINSKMKMKYSDVNKILEEDTMVEGYEQFHKDLLLMQKLAILLEQRFVREGMLQFESMESLIEVNKLGKLENMSKRESRTAEKLIEFFALQTNNSIGMFAQKRGLNMLYRVDEEPDEEKMTEVINFLKSKNIIELDKTCNYDNFDIQNIISQLSKLPLSERQIYQALVIRCLKKAYYSPLNKGHFPLGFDAYAQGTSPIRRGPDWRNHSILIYYLFCNSVEKTNEKYSIALLKQEGNNFSKTEREADIVEKEAQRMIIAEFIEDNLDILEKEEYEGRISCIAKNGIWVMLNNGIEGLIKNTQLPIDNYHQENTYSLVGENNSYIVGEKIKIKIKGASKEKRTIDFDISGIKRNKGVNNEKAKKKVKNR